MKKYQDVISERSSQEEEGIWETVIDFTRVQKEGIDIDEIWERLAFLDTVKK